nr:acyl-CoA thioesterase [Anaerolineae bacterium]
MTDLTLFRFSQPIVVRYADIDVLQHVNNAIYFTYMESARVGYLKDVLGWRGEWTAIGIIIARAACDYLAPIRWGDQVTVHLRTSRIGSKSFDFEYVITCQSCTGDGEPGVAARGSTVQVAYDYHALSTVPVPDNWRATIVAYEPGLDG